MILSGGNYGGYEVVGDTVVFDEIVVPFTMVDGSITVEGWQYNEQGIFCGTIE